MPSQKEGPVYEKEHPNKQSAKDSKQNLNKSEKRQKVCRKVPQGHTTESSICQRIFLKRNIHRHKRNVHCTLKYITPERHHRGACVDAKHGIYMISKSLKGSDGPINVQFNICGATQHVTCSLR